MHSFQDIGKNWDFYLACVVSIFPILSIIGHTVTADGRKSLKESPILMLYFVIMPAFGYFYWFDREVIYTFLGLNNFFAFALYCILCLGILIEMKIPH